MAVTVKQMDKGCCSFCRLHRRRQDTYYCVMMGRNSFQPVWTSLQHFINLHRFWPSLVSKLCDRIVVEKSEGRKTERRREGVTTGKQWKSRVVVKGVVALWWECRLCWHKSHWKKKKFYSCIWDACVQLYTPKLIYWTLFFRELTLDTKCVFELLLDCSAAFWNDGYFRKPSGMSCSSSSSRGLKNRRG